MIDKKFGVLLVAVLFILAICSSLVFASLEIKKEAVASMAVIDLKLPAVFKLQITNLGESDSFTIYSFAGVDILPSENFSIVAGETKEIIVSAFPTAPLKVSPDYLSFEFEIKGEKMGKQTEQLVISMVNLKDAFNINIDGFNPDSENTVIHFKNKDGQNFDKISLEIDSDLFSDKQEFSLASGGEKNLSVKIDKEKSKVLFAGPYIVSIKINAGNFSTSASSVVQFQEKPGIETVETNEGKIARRYEVEKINKGNTNNKVSIVITKDLFSSLFTSFNIASTKTDIKGIKKNYIFEKELAPGESLKVVAKTNWWILIGIIIVLLVLWYLIDRYLRNKIVLEKKATHVRTKGGEFALRVSIKVKARNFVERLRIFDRLPPMVKVFERTAIGKPDKIDEANRRLEWNIQALSRGEERELSYILYSKVGLMGKFELPQAEGIYEFEGKIKEASSNRVFFDQDKKRE